MNASTFFNGLLAPFYAAFETIEPTSNFLQFIFLSVVAFSMLRIILQIFFRKEY